MDALTKGYTVRSNATRGAKRAGLTEFSIKTGDDGLYYIVQPLPPGTYTATVAAVQASGDGNVKMSFDVGVAGGTIRMNDTIKPEPEEPQPQLAPETQATVNAVQMMAAADIARLAATLPKPVKSSTEQVQARRKERREKLAIPDPQPVAPAAEKTPSYKEMFRNRPNGTRSTAESPVKISHAHYAEHWGKRSRKTLIAEVVAMGINVATARSQYQIYKKRREAEAPATNEVASKEAG